MFSQSRHVRRDESIIMKKQYAAGFSGDQRDRYTVLYVTRRAADFLLIERSSIS